MTTQHDVGGESGDDRQSEGDETVARGSDDSGKDERRREALSNRAKAAEKALKEERAKREQLEERMAELEGKAGNFDRGVERLQSKVKSFEEENATLKAQIEARDRRDRLGSLVERVSSDSGVPAFRIKGLLLAAQAEDPDLDIYPEHVDERVSKSIVRALTAFDKDSFAPKETGKARPRPGPAPSAHQRGLADDERPTADALGDVFRHGIFQPPKDGRLV